ncbi:MULTISPECIES: hypothetical protein [unclassified Acinetobacter]|uniref:hypothetical protein n=1 Tax=unclassified Acinetobacter TaxID=196816 RepID=UPI002934396D|nr:MULTISPECIES: hypothetical protein [unclassified Acinetobacter]WOE32700.1 hypothetical protein QSG84_05830 [Acinetobacter sp. SAAs470]WOE38176.1 hypothetical protein QSG86_14885 [Acinetobacter sp. SAAs474]
MEFFSTLIQHKKIIALASLGLLIPIFIISMAFLAINSDAKNQAIYKQQHAEIIQRSKAKAAQQDAASSVLATEIIIREAALDK